MRLKDPRFRRDPALGATVLIGAGGTMTELHEDVAPCRPRTGYSDDDQVVKMYPCSMAIAALRLLTSMRWCARLPDYICASRSAIDRCRNQIPLCKRWRNSGSGRGRHLILSE